MKKLLNILIYLIFAVTAVVLVYFWMAKDERVGTLLVWGYIVLALGIVLLLLTPLFNIASNPKMLRKMAVSIGFIVVLFGLAFLLSSGDQTISTAMKPDPPKAQTLKIIDTGLIATYFLLAIALLSVLGGSVLASIRNR
ncbi:MAG: hypothetical protein FWG54_05710 [Bacteroidetes bacterium]|nr:hypothetical protein [Bacteroidota bacterium]